MPSPKTYRAFRRRSDAAWLNTLITTGKVAFTIPPEVHAEQVADAYGLTAADLDVLDGPVDPRVAPTVMPRQPANNIEPLLATLMLEIDAAIPGLAPNLRTAVQDRLRTRLTGG